MIISSEYTPDMTGLPNSLRGRPGDSDRHFLNTAIRVKTTLPKNSKKRLKLSRIFRVSIQTIFQLAKSLVIAFRTIPLSTWRSLLQSPAMSSG